VSSGISPFTIMETPQVRQEEVVIAVLSASESLRVLSSTEGLTTTGL
jgi:hypothetical protein